MDRLTFDGNFCDIAMCRETKCPYDGACTQRQVWERLKKYEETGLDPEEMAEMVSPETVEIARLLEKMCKEGSAQHMLELFQAEKDGRLWMLAVPPWPRPCKSNNVYIIDDGEIYEDSVIGSNIGMGPDGDIVCYYETFDGDGFYQKDIGKTVFLTREEAEAALDWKGGDG